MKRIHLGRDPHTGLMLSVSDAGHFNHGSACPICNRVRQAWLGYDPERTQPPAAPVVDFDLVGEDP